MTSVPISLPLQFPLGMAGILRRCFLLLSAKSSEGEISRSVVRQARAGDRQAFRKIVDHYDDRLRAMAYRLVEDRTLMDDCMQEAYLKAFKSMGRFRGPAGLGTWLYRITYNSCIDELRRRRDLLPLPVDDRLSMGANPGTSGEDAAADRADLASALSALPPDQRAAVMLVDAESYSYKEAAKILGCPPGTVASRVNRAHVTLRKLLRVVS